MKSNIIRHIKLLFYVLAGGIAVTSCDDSLEIEVSTPSINISFPKEVENSVIENDSLYFYDITNGTTNTIASSEAVNVPNGFYNVFYKADVSFMQGNERVKGKLRGTIEKVVINETNRTFDLKTSLIVDKDDFIFEEIFFTGTLRESGKQYYGDSYIKIYNNTDHVLYADGVAFVESKFVSTLNYKYNPDIREDTMTIQALYVIPGSGKEHPVQPGESMLICDTGIDHRVANPNSIDLTKADFEWYDVSTKPSHMDIDSEFVENLDKWYCYTLSFFVLHNRGFRSYALARIPISKKEYLDNYWYTYDYVISVPAGNFPMSQTALKLPNDWILDGVNCSVEAEWQFNILPVTIDGGWTHCGTIDHDKTRYFKSVRRKMLFLDANGKRVLKDTNNSADDFNTECVPSVMEEQHSSISADGKKAEVRTYDGVQVIKD